MDHNISQDDTQVVLSRGTCWILKIFGEQAGKPKNGLYVSMTRLTIGMRLKTYDTSTKNWTSLNFRGVHWPCKGYFNGSRGNDKGDSYHGDRVYYKHLCRNYCQCHESQKPVREGRDETHRSSL